MDFWEKAKVFAEEAAKKSHDLTKGAAKLQEFVSETAKKSKEIAAEASKKADQIKIEALKRADQIKTLAGEIPATIQSLPISVAENNNVQSVDLERFGITEDLREFIKEITINTFRDFPLQDEPEMSEVPTVSNVRQDLTEWQAKHATLVLSAVKEISKLRYELCPRYMKERKFWRIYFILVDTHVAPYEKQYVVESKEEDARKEEELKSKSKSTETEKSQPPPTEAVNGAPSKVKMTSSEQDLDVFLLGDGSDDEGPDDGTDMLDDDDLDKVDDILD